MNWPNNFWDRIQQWGEGQHLDRVCDFDALLMQFLFFAFTKGQRDRTGVAKAQNPLSFLV